MTLPPLNIMHFVCRTCSVVHSVVPERDSICGSCGARLLSPEPLVAGHAWYTSGAQGQAGPFGAAELARMFDRNELTWTDEVWRDGLRDWRPARKDDLLVVEVAGARGLDTTTVRLDSMSKLLTSQGEPLSLSQDTRVDALPASLVRSWTVQPSRPLSARPDRTHALTSVLKLATLALLAFLGGGVIVSLGGRIKHMAWPARVESPSSLSAASASLVTTAPTAVAPPSSGELVTRTLPAVDEVRAELRRLSPSVQRCARDPKVGLEVMITIAGDSGRPRQVDVRAPRLTAGMIECTRAALEELNVAPFTADQLKYNHHYTW